MFETFRSPVLSYGKLTSLSFTIMVEDQPPSKFNASSHPFFFTIIFYNSSLDLDKTNTIKCKVDTLHFMMLTHG